MEESVMRQEMGTWLKKECQDMGESLIGTADVIKELGIEAIIHSNPTAIDNIKSYIASDKFQPSKDKLQAIGVELDSVANDIKSGDKGKALQRLLWVAKEYTTIALEHTVECQCGKPTQSMGTAIHIGARVKIISGNDTGREGAITNIIHPDNPREPLIFEIQLDGSVHPGKYLESQFIVIPEQSTMSGIIINPQEAEIGPCRCTAGKELCWHPGIIGALNKEQKAKYCREWVKITE